MYVAKRGSFPSRRMMSVAHLLLTDASELSARSRAAKATGATDKSDDEFRRKHPEFRSILIGLAMVIVVFAIVVGQATKEFSPSVKRSHLKMTCARKCLRGKLLARSRITSLLALERPLSWPAQEYR